MRAIFLVMITNGIPVGLVGCAHDRDFHTITKQIGDYGLERIDDPERGVTCYWASDKDNIALSCVKTRSTGGK